MNLGTPPAEWNIDGELVRELLREQHPEFAGHVIRPLDVGWDNAIFRLGEDHLVRLPRRARAVPLAEHEHRWLPVLAERLPFPVPTPLRIGQPSEAYPWPWSIVPWLPGETADVELPHSDQAVLLADFLRALHQPAPAEAPPNELRGGPLQDRAPPVEERLGRLAERCELITPILLDHWERALDAPEAEHCCWLHGDLHARNILVARGAISGIIDWGDVTSGDAAVDLASVWMLFDEAEVREACLARYGADPDLSARAKGWAVLFGAVLLETGLADHARHAAMGETILRRLGEIA